mgnify:CR=1 FL=1
MKVVITTYLTVCLFTLVGCARSMTSVDFEASGYSDRPLTGRELLYTAKKYAIVSQYQFVNIRQQVQNASVGESTKNRMFQQIDFLQSRVGDNLELASRYYDPRNNTEAQQRQAFRAVTDRLDQISKEYLELVRSLSTAESMPKSE